MKHISIWVWVCLVGLFSAVGAQAQRPERPDLPIQAEPEAPVGLVPEATVLRLIKFSGVVRDGLGQPQRGVTGITFALYEEQESGAPLWLETQNVELDEKGRYTVLLGSTQSEGLPLELFTSGQARWLGIQVQGEVEQPRILLVSVPYALKAEETERLAGRTVSDFVLAETLETELREQAQTIVREEVETLTMESGITPAITTGPSALSGNNSTRLCGRCCTTRNT